MYPNTKYSYFQIEKKNQAINVFAIAKINWNCGYESLPILWYSVDICFQILVLREY